MDVNSATATSVGALVNSPQPQPAAPTPSIEKRLQEPEDSVVVKLSKQAQQLNRAEDENNNTERAVTKPKEAAEPSGIRFMEGKSEGGRVDTYA
ncbi:MAG: hypothetical protein K2P67_03085 [Gallionellaceae bacterium]|jgi:hypothetical protein|nr:hypothetical protein [Gallionellaceae bacterium]